MKSKPRYIFGLSAITILSLAGCANQQTNNPALNAPAYRLELRPNEKYLNKNSPIKSAPIVAGYYSSNFKPVRNIIKKAGENSQFYDFSISATEASKVIHTGNYNDLIIGANPVLLQPVAVALNAAEDDTGELTTEETKEKFNPITEFSQSGYGNAPIDKNLYGQAQTRTAYSISKSSLGELQSQYYDVSVTITDDQTSNAIDTSVDSSVGYQDDGYTQSDITSKILQSVSPDNNPAAKLSVTYFKTEQDAKDNKSNLTEAQLIDYLRPIAIDKTNHTMATNTVWYKVSDGINISTNYAKAAIRLRDNVSPVLERFVSNKWETVSQEANADIANLGAQFDYPDFQSDINSAVKKAFDNGTYRFYDEVDGVMSKAPSVGSVSDDGYTVSVTDNAMNTLYYIDHNTKIKEVDENDPDAVKDEYVWYSSDPETRYPFTTNLKKKQAPSGISYTAGIRWKFDGSEITLLGWNFNINEDYEEQEVINMKGTDGKGGIQIPATMKVNGHEYMVTKLARSAFSNTPVVNGFDKPTLFEIKAVYAFGSNPQDNVYDFRETNLSTFNDGVFLSPKNSKEKFSKMIIKTKQPKINNIIPVRYEALYIDKSVYSIPSIDPGIVYMNYSEKDVGQKMKDNLFQSYFGKFNNFC